MRLPICNRIDMAMVVFLMAVLISVATHWWEGTIKQVQQLPILIIIPYLLGRAMNVYDGINLRRSFMFGGLLIAILIFPEYLRYVMYGFPYTDSPYPHLFGKNVGSMMSGQLLAFGLIGLLSIYMSRNKEYVGQPFEFAKVGFFTFLAMSAMIFELVWAGSRGPLLIAAIGLVTYITFSSGASRKRKIKILLSVAFIFVISIYFIVQRHGAQEHYSHLIQKPAVLFEVKPETKNISPKQAVGGVSILGQTACDLIVDSVSERWIHYQQAIAIYLKNPLVGVGANNYGFYACQGPGAFPHNVILQVFTELGGIVGIVYGYVLWLAIRWPLRIHQSTQKNTWKLISTWLFAFTIMQVVFAVISGDYFASAHLYFAIGLAASAHDSSSA